MAGAHTQVHSPIELTTRLHASRAPGGLNHAVHTGCSCSRTLTSTAAVLCIFNSKPTHSNLHGQVCRGGIHKQTICRPVWVTLVSGTFLIRQLEASACCINLLHSQSRVWTDDCLMSGLCAPRRWVHGRPQKLRTGGTPLGIRHALCCSKANMPPGRHGRFV